MDRYLKDYAEDKKNDMTLAAVTAMQECKEGDVLHLGGGELHFYPQYAMERFLYISNNDLGMKRIVFPCFGKKNLTIDGDNARLVFHGKCMPFAVENSCGIVIRNLSVDYAEPMYFEAKIVDSGAEFVEMEYDESKFHCDVAGRQFHFYGTDWKHDTQTVLVNEFESQYKGPAGNTPTYFAFLGEPQEVTAQSSLYRCLRAWKPKQNHLRLEGNIGFVHTVGKYWLCTLRTREYPGIFAAYSKNLNICDVTLYHTLAMGVICQMCDDVIICRLQAVPSEGRMLSTSADATHFVNCSGKIHLKGCRFESMMDDALNIHGNYIPIHRKLSNHKVLLRFGHRQQQGVNIFVEGDCIRLVDNQKMQPFAVYEVKKSTLLSREYLLLEVAEPLPQVIPNGWVFENHSRMPEVYIKECSCGYNRPRGFLLTTGKKVIVERCEFYNLQHAIAIMGDANNWYESGPCGEVILRKNHFERAAYSGSSIIEGAPEIPQRSVQSYHGTLVLENNYFCSDEKRNISVSGFKEVILSDNYYAEKPNLNGGGVTF